MRRSLMVGSLVGAVIALVASAAVAVGVAASPSSGRSGGDDFGQGQGMMGGYGGQSQGMMGGYGGQGQGMMGGYGGQGQGMMGGYGGQGAAMMGGYGGQGAGGSMGRLWLPGNAVAVSSIPAARARAATAAQPSGLHPGEVMWFDNGFYVELKDKAGQPATEVIIDPSTGSVSTEPGPAMMWNTRFGMMRTGAGGAGSVDSAKARDIATSWLAANRAGTTVRTIDAYPGYFTLDVQRNGAITGMMSVSSATGAVWYHTWHGAFVAMQDS